MSDDHRLLQSLTRTLSVVLDNVRFRDREQQLRLLASRAELKALRAQINPHFLFNALNSIAGLIQDQPALADETIEQLAQVFRYTLRKSETEWVRLEEEIEFITAYLRVEQARFGHRLRVEVEIDPAAASVPVPAMTVQPLIENAIKHGASNVEGPATVTLRARVEAGVLAIEVRDNGPGFPPGFTMNGSGHGLRNVAERIHGYYGDVARLEWSNEEGQTRVSLTIPRRTSVASNDRR
jgi:LytS/YehU family sensor histidine kinase